MQTRREAKLGLIMVSALGIMSVLLTRLLLYLHATFLLASSNIKTASFMATKDAGFGQIPHRQRWLRALQRGISIALANVCVVNVSQEISARHLTPTTTGGKQAHTRGKHSGWAPRLWDTRRETTCLRWKWSKAAVCATVLVLSITGFCP